MKPWHYILVFLWSAGLYVSTTGHGFVLDDKAIITQNKFTQKGFGGITDHLTHSYWYGINGKDEGNYRPLSGISFSIERALFGKSPRAGHLLNILFYALLCCTLLYWLQQLRLLHPLLLLVVVLLFATHPLHTEVVANIKSRDEIYAFLFFLLSAILYWKWLSAGTLRLLLAACVLLFLSLLSKETSVALLPLYPLMALRKNPGFAGALKKWTGPLVVLGCYLGLYLSVTDVMAEKQYHLFDNALVQKAPALQLFATKLYILGKYILLFFLPYPLRYDYSYDTIPLASFGDPPVLLALVTLIALVFWGFRFLRPKSMARLEATSVALALLVLPLVPVSNLLFPIGSTMAERFLFVPVAGFSLLLVGSAHKLLAKWIEEAPARKTVAALGGVAIVAMSAGTVSRNHAWESDEVLFTTDLKHLENNAKAHHNVANIYSEKGDAAQDPVTKATYYESAIPLLERAIEIYPVQEFYKQLGQLYGNLGRWDGVIKTRKAYLQMNPNDALAWSQLGVAEGMTGNMTAALEAFEKAFTLNPNDINTCNNLGKTYGMLGRLDDAARMFEHVLTLAPGNEDAKTNLSITNTQRGR